MNNQDKIEFITGWITDPNRGYHLHDIIKYIPTDRLMIETDSPYLLPFCDDIVNKSYNEPCNLIFVFELMSEIIENFVIFSVRCNF